ncbi:DUF4124 domain-containing protein [Massilia genomosp. 1]|uniref:DUF4124 domain-containing protein n=1 Tax=Massilia genomosp. 1 TaxID=2609280 RepID=A0ABX0MRF4_9BURK|nr:DUF4124 domain-containing protein [Massilia genomosp. 1]NHZ65327.1 DUF4124 domain-containing protein [Massilia genomosp. 1]
MANLNVKRTLQLLAGGALMLFASVSYAQYVWVDANGTKQYSDRPPPPGIPAKNIIKQPGGSAKAGEAPAVSAPGAVPATADDKVPPSLADREADYRKRAKAKEEADKKASTAAAGKARNKAACEGARTYKRTLEQGTRVTTTDKKGEESFMDDAKRASELARANKAIAEACK